MPCQLCFITVTAGLGLSRWLGIDDTISGVWIGAFVTVLIIWTNNWLDKKNIKFKGRDLLTVLVYYASVFIPLWYAEIVGHPQNKIWGADKLMAGFLIGSVLFTAGTAWYDYIKKKNGKPHFRFEKVIAPVTPLFLMSAIFYFLTK